MEENDIYPLLDIAKLIARKRQGSLLPEEEKALITWLSESRDNEMLYEELMSPAFLENELDALTVAATQRAATKVYDTIRFEKQVHVVKMRPRSLLYKVVGVAAMLALLLGIYFTEKQTGNKPAISANQIATADVKPGHTGAILTLADGSTLLLDTMSNGAIPVQAANSLTLRDGALVYSKTGNIPAPTAYNTITTPNGRQFKVLLPDGTAVWLNAASSLRYPVTFNDKERRVEMSGEAYFEVAKEEARPFVVSTGTTTVDVLGTSFNISNYANEKLLTATLLTGKIKMNTPGVVGKILNPGDQAIKATTANDFMVIQHTDPTQVIAWKNGVFDFENVEMEQAMRQLARWYNLEVVYEKGIPDIRFGGKISRQMTLMHLLQVLEQSEVHFRLEEGRRLIVLP